MSHIKQLSNSFVYSLLLIGESIMVEYPCSRLPMAHGPPWNPSSPIQPAQGYAVMHIKITNRTVIREVTNLSAEIVNASSVKLFWGYFWTPTSDPCSQKCLKSQLLLITTHSPCSQDCAQKRTLMPLFAYYPAWSFIVVHTAHWTNKTDLIWLILSICCVLLLIRFHGGMLMMQTHLNKQPKKVNHNIQQ